MTELCIKYNNAAVKAKCAVCHARTRPEVGPELFVEGTWALVCDDCAKELSPTLYAVREREREYRAALDLAVDWNDHNCSCNFEAPDCAKVCPEITSRPAGSGRPGARADDDQDAIIESLLAYDEIPL